MLYNAWDLCIWNKHILISYLILKKITTSRSIKFYTRFIYMNCISFLFGDIMLRNIYEIKLKFFFFFFNLFDCAGSWLWHVRSDPWPRIKRKPHALGAGSLSHRTTREIPKLKLFLLYKSSHWSIFTDKSHLRS